MSKDFCEVPKHRKLYQMNNVIPIWRTLFTISKWKVEIGDDVQDLCREALFPK